MSVRGQLGVYMTGSEAPARVLGLSRRTNMPPTFEPFGTSMGLGGRATLLLGGGARGRQFPESGHPGLGGARVQQVSVVLPFCKSSFRGWGPGQAV